MGVRENFQVQVFYCRLSCWREENQKGQQLWRQVILYSLFFSLVLFWGGSTDIFHSWGPLSNLHPSVLETRRCGRQIHVWQMVHRLFGDTRPKYRLENGTRWGGGGGGTTTYSLMSSCPKMDSEFVVRGERLVLLLFLHTTVLREISVWYLWFIPCQMASEPNTEVLTSVALRTRSLSGRRGRRI